MHLIQILLPFCHWPTMRDIRSPGTSCRPSRRNCRSAFGGLTAYSRAPAKGVWTQSGGQQEDDIIIVEVMAETLDERWWRDFRRRLEERLGQEELVIRAQEMRTL
jgi:hypothetical protein